MGCDVMDVMHGCMLLPVDVMSRGVHASVVYDVAEPT